uniref:Transmembrane protein n=1 Tax=Sparus aurata TaxID=8175 RepID=A0A671YQ31_SPAAU
MAVDWIGFGYAAAIALGGFMGYKRKGQKSTLDDLMNLFWQKDIKISSSMAKPNVLLLMVFRLLLLIMV